MPFLHDSVSKHAPIYLENVIPIFLSLLAAASISEPGILHVPEPTSSKVRQFRAF